MKLTARPKTVIYLALLIFGSCMAPMTAAQQSSGGWDFVSIIAPPQTVTVETPWRSYTAAFENEARVYPDGRARGVLELSGPDGSPHRFRVLAGRVRFDDGTVTRAVLQLREVDPGDHPRLEITVVIQPVPMEVSEGSYQMASEAIADPEPIRSWVAHVRMLAIRR